MFNFEHRVIRLSTNVLRLIIRLFCQIVEIGARGVKSSIGLIFKSINFEARVMKLSKNVLWLNIRLFCQIGKIKFPPPFLLGGWG